MIRDPLERRRNSSESSGSQGFRVQEFIIEGVGWVGNMGGGRGGGREIS
jgi:hypothetical protein